MILRLVFQFLFVWPTFKFVRENIVFISEKEAIHTYLSFGISNQDFNDHWHCFNLFPFPASLRRSSLLFQGGIRILKLGRRLAVLLALELANFSFKCQREWAIYFSSKNVQQNYISCKVGTGQDYPQM